MAFEKNAAASEIKNCLDDIAEKLSANDSTKAWTNRILEDLAGMGAKKFGMFACATGQSNTGNKNIAGEWLYDLCWAEAEGSDDGDWNLLRLCLIAECEWLTSEAEIGADFDKLMQCRADLRLMILDGERKEIADKKIQNIKKRIMRYRNNQAGDIYLVAAYDGSDSPNLKFHYFRLEVTSVDENTCRPEIHITESWV